MGVSKSDKEQTNRMFSELFALTRGEELSKDAVVNKYGIHPRTFTRDISALREFASENGMEIDLKGGKYHLNQSIDADHLIMLANILLADGSFSKNEKNLLLETLLSPLTQSRREQIKRRLGRDDLAYLSRNQEKDIIPIFKVLNNAITAQKAIRFTYRSTREKSMRSGNHEHNGMPDCLFYDHGHFYCAMNEHASSGAGDTQFRIYRLDRFLDYSAPRTNVSLIPEKRFDLAAHRRNTYMMNSGNRIRVELDYRRYPQLVKDAFPTAEIGKYDGDAGTRIVIPEVAFSSIKLWAFSQGADVTIRSPENLRAAVMEEATAVTRLYAQTNDE